MFFISLFLLAGCLEDYFTFKKEPKVEIVTYYLPRIPKKKELEVKYLPAINHKPKNPKCTSFESLRENGEIIIFVDINVKDSGNGESFEKAFKSINQALRKAAIERIDNKNDKKINIFVASGFYSYSSESKAITGKDNKSAFGHNESLISLAGENIKISGSYKPNSKCEED